MLLALILASAESAISIEPIESHRVEEVLITARMREESIHSVPLALSVYGDKALRALKVSSLEEIENSTPNINFGRGGRNTRGEISIRGVGDFSRNLGSNARVAVYIDGIPTGRSDSFDQDLGDTERVEILRGPQGTLFGKNTVSGAINIVTKRPYENYSARFFSEVGNFNLRKNSLAVNIPLSEKLFTSFRYSLFDKDGFIENTLLERDLNGNNRKSGNAKLRYIGSDVEINFDFRGLEEYSDATNAEALSGGSFGGFLFAQNEYEVAHDAEELQNRSMYSGSLNIDFSLKNNFNIVYLGGYRENKVGEINEEDYSPLDIATSFNNEELQQYTQEIRLISPKTRSGDYVVGLYYSNEKAGSVRGANGGSDFFVSDTDLNIPAQIEFESLSAYSHGRLALSEKLFIDAGIRYVYEDKKILYSSFDTTGLFINVRDVTDKIGSREFLPKIGLSYRSEKDTLIYTTISRGFKAGGWNADSITTLENFKFDEETAINYEVGLKTTLLNEALAFSLIGYVVKFDEFQVFQFVPTSDGGTILSLTNASEVTSSGFELDSTYKINTSLRLTTNIAYTRARFDSFKDGGGLGIDYDGNALPYAPEKSYFVSLNYSKNISDDIKFNYNINYSYNSEQFSNPNNFLANTIPSRRIIGSSADISIGEQWRVLLWVKNWTNEVDLRQKTASFLGEPRGYYDAPRTYGVSASYSLGK